MWKHTDETWKRANYQRSKAPAYQFADTLAEQEAQLAANPMMARFADSRRALASDPHRPLYHFVSPESTLNDPNGLCYWQGKWHLFLSRLSAGRRRARALGACRQR